MATCEVCGRPEWIGRYDQAPPEQCSAGDAKLPEYEARCYEIGYARERAARETAERERDEAREAVKLHQRIIRETRGEIADLVGHPRSNESGDALIAAVATLKARAVAAKAALSGAADRARRAERMLTAAATALGIEPWERVPGAVAALQAALAEARAEAQRLRVELLRAYIGHYREGWEQGPSTDEAFDRVLSILYNAGLDPGVPAHAKAVAAALANPAAEAEKGKP